MRIIIKFLICVLIVGCQQPDQSFAPSDPDPYFPEIPDPQGNTSTIKYGQTITTMNGWKASLDTADFVQPQTLPNGWTVEVKYE